MSINLQGSSDAAKKFRDTNLTNVAVSPFASPCELTGWAIYNSNSADAFVKFCDTNSSGTTNVGTTAVEFMLLIPAQSQVVEVCPKGTSHHYFENGMVLYAVTGAADSSTTAPTTGLTANIYYKPSA